MHYNIQCSLHLFIRVNNNYFLFLTIHYNSYIPKIHVRTSELQNLQANTSPSLPRANPIQIEYFVANSSTHLTYKNHLLIDEFFFHDMIIFYFKIFQIIEALKDRRNTTCFISSWSEPYGIILLLFWMCFAVKANSQT